LSSQIESMQSCGVGRFHLISEAGVIRRKKIWQRLRQRESTVAHQLGE
jgi:hypothetical protein